MPVYDAHTHTQRTHIGAAIQLALARKLQERIEGPVRDSVRYASQQSEISRERGPTLRAVGLQVSTLL